MEIFPSIARDFSDLPLDSSRLEKITDDWTGSGRIFSHLIFPLHISPEIHTCLEKRRRLAKFIDIANIS